MQTRMPSFRLLVRCSVDAEHRELVDCQSSPLLIRNAGLTCCIPVLRYLLNILLLKVLYLELRDLMDHAETLMSVDDRCLQGQARIIDRQYVTESSTLVCPLPSPSHSAINVYQKTALQINPIWSFCTPSLRSRLGSC